MRNLIIAAAMLLLSITSAQAQIIIPRQSRIPNVQQGCCGPATVEAVARFQGYGQLHGYTKTRASLPYGKTFHDPVCGKFHQHPCHSLHEDLTHKLRTSGVPYQSRPVGSYDQSLISRGLSTGRPVIVGVRGETYCQMGHYYAVVGQQPGKVLLYDSNKTQKPYVAMSNKKFQSIWSGESILLGR